MSISSIAQGETNWYSTYVAPGTTELVIDLNWGDASNSLRLRIYTPRSVLGPYYNAYDGVNGRIYLHMKDTVNLHSGIWQFEVYGYQVTGAQDYTIIWR
ncbi:MULTISPECIES: hypothetical protein [Methanoculleus]|jgi:hypothetical protein|uniref:hypothetical protein n=1 Tax=Methanoculleus TaxID=45989 RepID=UPI002023E444|nr:MULTISPECIES: hypothetical protein [Methanoculleus]MDD3373218.1 hypothetical protein [Methanoculleus bourgensis]